MGTLRLTRDSETPTSGKIDRSRLLSKVLGQYITKLELMASAKKAPEYIQHCAETYGLEWIDYSDKLKSYLVAYSPKPKKTKAADKVEAKVEESAPVETEKPKIEGE
jgi:hypothetical protein